MRDTSRWITALLFTASLGAALTALAEPPAAKSPPALGVKLTAPLGGPLKLPASAKPLPPLPVRDSLDQAYEQFRQVTARAKAARDAYVTARTRCAARSFSVQDQREAGCQETDTVAQCNDKLELWCTRSEGRVYRRSNHALLLASENLKTAMSAYIAQVRQLPEEE